MSDGSPAGTRKRLAVGVAAAGAAGLVLYLAMAPRAAPPLGRPGAPPAPAAVVEAPAAEPPGQPTAPPAPAAVVEAPAPEPEVAAAQAVPETVPAPAQDVAAPAPDAAAPGFDLVRVAPDGAAVVAGRASPGALVTIYADNAPLAEAAADADGNFVAIFRATPSEAPQALTLGAVLPGGEEIVSGDVVMLLPEAPGAAAEAGPARVAPGGPGTPAPEASVPVEVAVAPPGPAAPAPVEVAVAPPGPPASEPQPEAGPAPRIAEAMPPAAAAEMAEVEAEPATAALAPAAEAATVVAAADPGASAAVAGSVEEGRPPARVAATAILRADGVEVVNSEPARPRQVSLASISYADGGEVTLAGLGTAGARLRAYVDDGFAQEATVGADGRWSLDLGEVEQGVYRLRIDQIDPAGVVASRVETPFQRDLPRPPLRRPQVGDRPVQVTVQPGANLWTLARVHYGSGVLYTQIFTANSDLIRNPDLIYPGQIFDLPGVEGND